MYPEEEPLALAFVHQSIAAAKNRIRAQKAAQEGAREGGAAGGCSASLFLALAQAQASEAASGAAPPIAFTELYVTEY